MVSGKDPDPWKEWGRYPSNGGFHVGSRGVAKPTRTLGSLLFRQTAWHSFGFLGPPVERVE